MTTGSIYCYNTHVLVCVVNVVDDWLTSHAWLFFFMVGVHGLEQPLGRKIWLPFKFLSAWSLFVSFLISFS
jgi:hypothetical protein